MAKRSGSSDAFRKNLAQTFAVPDVWSVIPLEKYYQMADKLYKQAIETVESGDLVLSYKFLQNYVTLIIDKIPQHNSYKFPKYSLNRSATKNSALKCLKLLETICASMDRYCERNGPSY